jgi:predicted transcriptional regulator
LKKGFSTMNNYPVRYAFRLDPATERALEQIARQTFQSKASIMRRYVQEGVAKEAVAYAEGAADAIKSAQTVRRL